MHTNGPDRYSILFLLKSSESGQIFKARDSVTDLICMIKRIPRDPNRNFMERTRTIADRLRESHCPFLAEIYDFYEDESHCYVVQELCGGGDLTSLIIREEMVPENKAVVIFCEMMMGLHILHSQYGIIHRDLKLESVMLDDAGHVKITDFFLFSVCDNTDEVLKRTVCGSPGFVAPEIILRDGYNSKSDIWSAGVILYMLVVGWTPFEASNVQECFHKILEGEIEYPETLSADCRDLLGHLLERDIATRYSAKQVLESPWLQKCPAYGPLQDLLEKIAREEWDQTPHMTKVISDRLKLRHERVLSDLHGNVDGHVTSMFRMLRSDVMCELVHDVIGGYDNGYSGKIPNASPADVANNVLGLLPVKPVRLNIPRMRSTNGGQNGRLTQVRGVPTPKIVSDPRRGARIPAVPANVTRKLIIQCTTTTTTDDNDDE